MTVISIVLADDHHVVRQGLRSLLETESDFQVVGETGDGQEAKLLVERLKPNVLVTDLMMPGLNGLELARQIASRHSTTRVVILSMHANEAYVMEALRNGATGYVLKESGAPDLILAVRAAAAGQRFLSPPLSERAIESYIQKAEGGPPDAYERLTPREREVLQLAAEGHSNAEIAARLSISPRTAETHRGNLMRKLGLQNQTALIRYALRKGVLPMGD
jgi:DNA-binding NarL/FixJ family response regulator